MIRFYIVWIHNQTVTEMWDVGVTSVEITYQAENSGMPIREKRFFTNEAWTRTQRLGYFEQTEAGGRIE